MSQRETLRPADTGHGPVTTTCTRLPDGLILFMGVCGVLMSGPASRYGGGALDGITLASLIDLYIFTPGRRLYALRQVRERAEARGLADVVRRVDRALEHEKRAADLESRWGAGLAKDHAMPSEIDPLIDRTLQVIEQMLQNCAMDSDPEVARHANGLVSTLFPGGVTAHIQLPYIDQLAANERVLAVLEARERREWIERLGLRMYVRRLRELNNKFDEALLARDRDKQVEYSDVREAREIGQRHLLQVTAKILGLYCEDEDADTRTALLEPIVEQNEQIRAYRRRRRRVVDIDADTGTPLEDRDAADSDDAGRD